MFKLLKNMGKQEVAMAILCAILVIAQVYFDLLLPDFMSELTVLIQSQGAVNSILLTGLKMLGCTLASAGLAVACGYLSARVAGGFSFNTRRKLFNHVMSLGQAEMNGFSVPSLITRTTNDISQVQMLISMGLQNIIKAPIMAVWAIIKMVGKSGELSLVTAIAVVLIVAVVIVVMSIVLPRFRIVQKLTDKLNGLSRENVSGINVVHAFNAEEYQNNKFEQTNTKMMKTQLFNQRVFAVFQPYMSFMMNGLSLVIYWLGAALLNGIVGFEARLGMLSNIVVFGTYAGYVVMSFMMLVMIFMMLPPAQVSAERVNQVLNAKPSIIEGVITNSALKGNVEFKNVSFKYPDSNEYELENITFEVTKSQTLAIIGATGSGKSTLINLIARFYDATDGEILVDGINIKDYTFDALYNKLGYVTQKAVLFSGSIRQNITFGQSVEEIDEEDVAEAIKLSQAEEFVNKLPQQTEHYIAQAGKNVSGGQKQRLAIARALARKPEILIFDDSFSALDYKTDARLRSELENNLADTTKIIVAQRISTIKNADKIIVLDDGKIVGMGTHEQLIESCKVYQEIAYSQLSASELKGGK
ncbi:MAG: ABC transporter ATP-binding protein [Clostridia bacterium]|nr:ABC transporter ATP-binding protein [Clostridia bacterium]